LINRASSLLLLRPDWILGRPLRWPVMYRFMMW
jgi:hypothetical protein